MLTDGNCVEYTVQLLATSPDLPLHASMTEVNSLFAFLVAQASL
jgi:hypothetical protein